MSTLFEFVGSLTEKKPILTPENEREYSPYIIEKALSMGMQNVLFVNEMNIRPGIAKRHHYDYLMGVLPRGKQYNKWAKKEVESQDDINVVIDYYNVSEAKALEILPLLSSEQLQAIRDRLLSKEMNR